MSQEIYDLIVIGGGSAALSAGIYAGRAMLDTLIIEKDKIGGQVTTTSEIVNYPAIRATTGPELMEDMRLQALDFGVEFTTDEIIDVDLSQTVKTVKSATKTYQAYAVIIATGASARKIGFPGEIEFTGRGIAYCSTCDGEFFQGLDIFVLGGGYAAAEEAVYLTRYGKSVTMIIREPDFTCAKLTAEAAKQHPDIKIVYNTEVKEITGDDFVRKAVFVNNETGEETTYEAPADSTFGMFVFAGNKPSTEIFEGKVELDRGYVPTNENMETNVPGVYAAGDLRIKELRQIVTAVADGAIAATNAQKYITEEKTKAGLPIVNERMEKRLAMQHAENKEAQPKAEKKPAKATSGNNTWFPDAMREQLGGIFGKLTKNVTLLQVMDSSEEKSLELNSFLTEFASLSDKILLETVEKGTDVEAKYGIDKLPSVVVLNNQGEYTGIKFSGIPSGHEVNSIVLAVYNVGSAGQPIEEPIVNKIKALPKKKVQIFVSLTCHYCPDVVAACQRIASINHNVEAEMIDIGVFPELKTEKKIMSVPAMIIDDQKIVFGSKNMDEIVEILEK
ncbi:thioredoxin-disulfide reductase [Enterococcus sp. 7E2_DIV0204]|uniref:FAD-dependent oxidoreductase n=1 Tax=unclassified Enterococcus TaxID=2608891 RepID=UPI000A35699B|nr:MULTISPECIES: FAD-dependent oxidoreductase [unclassified Enterococcus]OTN89638.1 thioredoxin-disulfide reductase [Enterococcus sp. 7E2_DIV0204]OTP52096.1 thioredoxin-disulfide reductase [Enterococcus sp. 7D2_DIV0200]